MDIHQLTQQAEDRVRQLAQKLLASGIQMACAESCTGGLLAKLCTDQPGSSAWFDRAYVTYSNSAKIQMLGVAAGLLEQYGAVSEQVAQAMVEGVVNSSDAQVAVSITGIAGPGGGTPEKPVGTVCFAFAIPGNNTTTTRMSFAGNREQVRMQSVVFVLDQLLATLK